MNIYPLPLVESVIKECVYEIYNTSSKDKKKMKWLQKYKKTEIKVTLPYIQGLSERLRRGLKKFHINVDFNNNYTLGKLLNNNKDSDKMENLSNVVYLMR